jgi:ABC-type nitrate/sulfonate/bicarbonate transport system permease component
MIHTAHGLHIYKKKHHKLISLGVILLPVIFIIVLGGISHLDTLGIASAVGLSLFRLAVAYAISLVVGVALAIIFGGSKFGDSVMPIFDVLQNVPSFALIPVFALLLGYTNSMAIIFAATSIVWPILFYVLSAIKTARTDLNEAATVFGASGFKRVWYYLLPLSYPAIITGSIVGISIGWEAVIGIEIIGLSNGIGVFLNHASTAGNRPLLTAGVLGILLLVFTINKVLWVPLLRKTKYYAE